MSLKAPEKPPVPSVEKAVIPSVASKVAETPMRIFFRKPTTVIFTGVMVAMILIGFIGPYFGRDPIAMGNPVMHPPSADFWLGTDHLGRDYLARILHGGRTSLIVGFAVAAICMTIAVVVGGIAGFYGGVIDAVLVKIIEFFQVIPGLVLALVAAAILGANVTIIIVLLGVTMWTGVARIMRAEAARIAELGYVESARAAGLPAWRILVTDVLPNAIAPVIVSTTMTVGLAILAESGLSFLGIGDANQPTWGSLLSEAQPYLNSAWWLAFFPGLCIFLVVLAINMIGDALNDSLNPMIGRVK